MFEFLGSTEHQYRWEGGLALLSAQSKREIDVANVWSQLRMALNVLPEQVDNLWEATMEHFWNHERTVRVGKHRRRRSRDDQRVADEQCRVGKTCTCQGLTTDI